MDQPPSPKANAKKNAVAYDLACQQITDDWAGNPPTIAGVPISRQLAKLVGIIPQSPNRAPQQGDDGPLNPDPPEQSPR